MSLITTKSVLGVSMQVQHKLGCTASGNGKRLEFSDLESRGIVLSLSLLIYLEFGCLFIFDSQHRMVLVVNF